MWPFFQGWFNKELNIKESYYELKCFELLLNFYFDLYIKFLRVLLACKGFTPETGMWVLDSQSCGYLTNILILLKALKMCTNGLPKVKSVERRPKWQVIVRRCLCWCTCDLGRAMTDRGRAPSRLPRPRSLSVVFRPRPRHQCRAHEWTLGWSPLNKTMQCGFNTICFKLGLSTPIWVWAQQFVWLNSYCHSKVDNTRVKAWGLKVEILEISFNLFEAFSLFCEKLYISKKTRQSL